jgi:imidazolonepropionase-like amidohydrolase
MPSRFLLFALPFLLVSCTAQESTSKLKAIIGATLIDGRGGTPASDTVVVIENGRIKAAGPRATTPVPAAAEKVDGTGRFLIPGLVDLHVHLGAKAGPAFHAPDYTRERVEQNLAAYAYFGVTTVRSVGTERQPGFDVRRDQLAGKLTGARLFTAGRGFTAPGGHPSQEIGDIARQPKDAADARAQVAELATQSVDLIKIWVDPRRGQSPKVSFEVTDAVIEEAAKHRIPVVSHIHSLADTRRLFEKGGAGFLHMVRDTEDIDPAFLTQLKAKQIVFTPTLVRQELAWLFGDRPELLDAPDVRATMEPAVLDAIRKAAAGRKPDAVSRLEFGRALRNSRKFALAGVPIGVGSDGGSSNDIPGAMTHREIELLVEAGFTPLEALTAATRTGALALGKLDELGTIEPGKRADLVLLTADPLADVRNLRKIERVLLDGEWTKRQ